MSHWFYRTEEEGDALAQRLKLTPCPHCQMVGALIRHGFLYGFDDSHPHRKVLRARRIFCSNRQARPGCGRTFSVWLADKIRRLSLTTAGLWQFLQQAVADGLRAALRASSCSRSDRTWLRIWKRFHLGQSKIRTALLGRCAAARPADRTPTGGSGPRPSPGRLPRRPLSDRRLPTDAAHLLRVSRFPRTPIQAGFPLAPGHPWVGGPALALQARSVSPNCQRAVLAPAGAKEAFLANNASCHRGRHVSVLQSTVAQVPPPRRTP